MAIAPLPVPIPLAEIRAAQRRLAGVAAHTPLLRLDNDAGLDLWVKPESLQAIGSFKIRGAANVIALADPELLAHGVLTPSAGNMAQGLAWIARGMGIACTAIVPDHAPRAKLDTLERLGARVVPVSFDRWWQAMVEHRFPGVDGVFVHPASDRAVIAGNGTIGLEILEDLPEVAAVVVPYGGGGLSSGIASAIKALRPEARVFAAEVETAAPLAASLAAGRPMEVAYTPSWVDGIGGRTILEEIWPLASALLNGSIVVSLDAAADGVRLLSSRGRVIAEGAGGAAVAAALTGGAGSGPVVAVVSGGNLDAKVLAAIVAGRRP